VKSLLGEFSSGLSVCRNKGPQIWGSHFQQGPYGRGMGGPSSGSVYGGDHPHF